MNLIHVKVQADTLLAEYEDSIEVEGYEIEQELLDKRYRDDGTGANE